MVASLLTYKHGACTADGACRTLLSKLSTDIDTLLMEVDLHACVWLTSKDQLHVTACL